MKIVKQKVHSCKFTQSISLLVLILQNRVTSTDDTYMSVAEYCNYKNGAQYFSLCVKTCHFQTESEKVNEFTRYQWTLASCRVRIIF